MSKNSSNAPETPNPFGDRENKSLEATASEVKTASKDEADTQPAPKPTGGTVRVQMIHHGSHDGKDLLPGETYELPRQRALSLIATRRANLSE